ncbi:MAG: hypothetical protein JW943_12600 [Deltaproteobacteria bacterium]|nr:hypothetical protein [Deltaproteobacteria bacterium]
MYLLYAFNWYMTNIETVIDDAYAVGKIINPKKTKMDKKADEIYSYLLERPIHEKMENAFGKIGENPPYPE